MKKKNTITYVILALVLIFAGWLLFRGNPQSRNSSQTTIASETVSSGTFSNLPPKFDFGEVSMTKGKVAHVFEIQNDTGAPVTVGQIYTSCMCTTANFTGSDGKTYGPFGMAGMGFIPSIDSEVASGGKARIEAIFDPAAHGPAGIGPIEREIIATLSNGKQIVLKFKAVVTP